MRTFILILLMEFNFGGLSKVFKLQKRALRIIFSLPSKKSCRNVFQQHKILTVPCIFILTTLTFIKNNPLLFNLSPLPTGYNTRHKLIRAQTYKLATSFKTIDGLGIQLMNKLPLSIRNLDNNKFHNALVELFKETAFYDVSEFCKFDFNDSSHNSLNSNL
uniref:Putative secreted protein n=1 Tax=Xenopsylla cheopis TaxID=163159 RepID=A0A6M2DZ25_XENCH